MANGSGRVKPRSGRGSLAIDEWRDHGIAWEETSMALRKGEIYHCTKEGCGCEIEVIKAAGPAGGDQAPRCRCGMPMQKLARVSDEAGAPAP